MKICVKETQNKANLKLLNSSMLENEIQELETTRSCPTGYSKRELRNTETIELLHLRKTTYEYLNLRSSKTRNAEFIYLVKRINRELERRKINIPVSQIDTNNIDKLLNASSKDSKECISNILKEFNDYAELLNKTDKGEYCYLARKRGASTKEIVIDNFAICNSHFGIAKTSENLMPGFLQDDLPNPQEKNKQSFDYDLFSSVSSTEVSAAEKAKRVPKKEVLKISESYGFDDMSCFVPLGGMSCNHEFDADEVLFLIQHN